MKYFQIVLLILAVQLIPSDLPAQKLGKLLKDAANDISTTLGDALADKAIERLADKIMGKLDKSIDSLFRDEYEKDTSYRSKTYNDFLVDFDKSSELPSSYKFSMNINFESIDDKGEKTNGVYRFTDEENIMGVGVDNSLIVFDGSKELMVTYDMEDMAGYATSDRFLRLGASLVTDEMLPDYSITKTDEFKNILNYRCRKYVGSSSDGEQFMSYVTEDFPVDLKSFSRDLFGKLGSSKLEKMMTEFEGMTLESENTDKDGKTWYWKVTDISKNTFSLDNSSFDFGKSPD